MKTDGGLRGHFRAYLPAFHWVSVESGMTGSGIPDSNFAYAGVERWIEYKKTHGWQITLEAGQVGWHVERARAGGRSFVAVRRMVEAGPRRMAADELWLYNGRYARELLDGGIKKAPSPSLLGMWTGGPASWNWDQIGQILIA